MCVSLISRQAARKSLALSGVILFGLAFSTIPADSASASDSLVVRGSATATSTVGTSIVIGDTFTFEMTLNLASASTSAIASSARTFNDAVDAFSLYASDENSGTWSASGITWSISPVHNLTLNENSDQLNLQVRGSGAPQINGVDFLDVVVTLDWDAADVDVQLSGATQTLANALGMSTPDTSLAQYFFELRDTSFSSASFSAQYRAEEEERTQTNANVDSSPSPSIPGIYLYVAGSQGDEVSGTSIHHGAYAVAPNSPYSLTVEPRVSGRGSKRVLAAGVTSRGGHVEEIVQLGALPAGPYKIVMVSYSVAGQPLVLTNHVDVDANGRFVSVSPESAQPVLK